MNTNWTAIFAAVLQALITRSAAFAVTIGGRHFAVAITENAAAGNSGTFVSVLQVVGTVLSGQPGTFTIGVFSVSITPLVSEAASGNVSSPISQAQSTAPAQRPAG